jgi:hypothetical protein
MLKSVDIIIEAGRDKGKKFTITEMPAVKMDKWATKALIILGKTGNSFNLAQIDLESLLRSLSSADYEGVEPLLEELLSCATFEKDGVSMVMTSSIADGIVEDWTTLFRLRIEALKLNLGFFEQGDGSTED